jgi:hypothetical protein
VCRPSPEEFRVAVTVVKVGVVVIVVEIGVVVIVVEIGVVRAPSANPIVDIGGNCLCLAYRLSFDQQW